VPGVWGAVGGGVEAGVARLVWDVERMMDWVEEDGREEREMCVMIQCFQTG
jgi:hypothetical protein